MGEKKLQGKVALITGGASGIGEATAKLFAAQGCKVALVDINGERLKKVAEEIAKDGGECI